MNAKRSSFRVVKALLIGGLLLLLALMAVPNFVKARVTRSWSSCLFYLMWIEQAKLLWAADQGKSSTDIPNEAELKTWMQKISPRWNGEVIQRPLPFDQSGKLRLEMICPAGGRIEIGPVGKRASCTLGRWDEEHFQSCYGAKQ
ncbi:MAG: hypothetical protein AB1813_00840 [Verrucomicrobiota bacterium]